MKKILVAYATVSGSTREIAEFVCKEISTGEIQAELRPCKEVKDLSGYNAVVLGFPLYMFQMNGDTRGFLNRHQKTLASLPVAVFAGGPFGDDPKKDLEKIVQNLNELMAKFTWLHPRNVQVVGGKFDPKNLKFPYNLIPAMNGLPFSDARDWDEIRAWAQTLPALLN